MSAERPREPEAHVAAVRSVFEGEEATWELVLKRSRGCSLTLRRGERSQADSWTEEALAVRVALPDGRSALASAAGRDAARRTAESALADARRQPLPAGPQAPFADASAPSRPSGPSEPHDSPSAPPEPPGETDGFAAPEPPAPEELAPLLDAVLESLRAEDERADRLELGRVRQARVTSRLWSSAGLDVEVVQPLALLEAEAIGREISRHAGSFDALAGPRLGLDDARRLGERLGRAVRRQLDGVPRGPGRGGMLLAPEVVGEISFRLAPALLGLEPCAALGGEAAPRLGAGLRLAEDSATDAEARSVPVDGVGRPLRALDLAPAGVLAAPEPSRLPLVRPGIADPPQPGWLRLSWSTGEGLGDEELVERLGTGLYLERAVTDSIDAASLTWRGRAEGWWVENGVGKRPVARLPLELALAEVLPVVVAAGAEPRLAHASGTIRAVPWLLAESAATSGG